MVYLWRTCGRCLLQTFDGLLLLSYFQLCHHCALMLKAVYLPSRVIKRHELKDDARSSELASWRTWDQHGLKICKPDAFIPNDSLLLPSDPLRAPYHQSRLPLPVLVRQDHVHQGPQDSWADGLCSRLLLLQLHSLLHGSLRGFQPLLARRP